MGGHRSQDVVVDTSVLFAALLKDGRAREALRTSQASLHIPSFGLAEVAALVPRASKLAGIPEPTVRVVLGHLSLRLTAWAPEAYATQRPRALSLAHAAQANGDEEFIALALALGAPVWTYDHDFRRVAGIRTLSTTELLGLPLTSS